MRALGGVAVFLQSAGGQPRLPRRSRTLIWPWPRAAGKRRRGVLAQAGYVADEMFNALRGSRRLLYHDPRNGRHVDVFVGEFSMCHELPLTARLDRDPLTVPREELLLSKLQIVELTENDQLDIYNLLYHHDVGERRGAGISSPFIAALCARDWGLWRTCQLNIGRSLEQPGLHPGSSPPSRRWSAAGWRACAGGSTPSRNRGGGGCGTRWATRSAGTQEPEQEQPGGE